MKQIMLAAMGSLMISAPLAAQNTSFSDRIQEQADRIKRKQACLENPNWERDTYCRSFRESASGTESLDDLKSDISDLDFRITLIEDRLSEIEDRLSDFDWRIHEIGRETR